MLGRAGNTGLISYTYAAVIGTISASASVSAAFTGGLIGLINNTSLVNNSYYHATRKSGGDLPNALDISQTLMQLRALNVATTGWTAFYDASAGNVLVTDNSATLMLL